MTPKDPGDFYEYYQSLLGTLNLSLSKFREEFKETNREIKEDIVSIKHELCEDIRELKVVLNDRLKLLDNKIESLSERFNDIKLEVKKHEYSLQDIKKMEKEYIEVKAEFEYLKKLFYGLIGTIVSIGGTIVYYFFQHKGLG